MRLLHPGSRARHRRPARAEPGSRARPRSASTWRATSAAARATSASSPRSRRLPGSSQEGGHDGGDRNRSAYVGRRIPRVEAAKLPPRARQVRRRHPAARDAPRGLPAQPVRAREGDPRRRRGRPGARRRRARAHRRGHRGDLAPIATGLPREEVVANSRPVLPAEKVRFVGEAVACVIATSRYVAEDAVQLVDVDYEPLPVVIDAEQAARGGRAAPARRDRVEQLRPHRVRARETSRGRSPRPTTSSRSASTTAASTPLPLEGRGLSPTGTPARRR